jgi:hypothetical protein
MEGLSEIETTDGARDPVDVLFALLLAEVGTVLRAEGWTGVRCSNFWRAFSPLM